MEMGDVCSRIKVLYYMRVYRDIMTANTVLEGLLLSEEGYGGGEREETCPSLSAFETADGTRVC